jgi:hypothetical protein
MSHICKTLYVYELSHRDRRLRERRIINLQDKKSEKHKAYGKDCNPRLKKEKKKGMTIYGSTLTSLLHTPSKIPVR